MTTVDVALVAAEELAGLPGAPFSQDQVDAAADMLRRRARWHIAPEVRQTVVVATEGGRDLFLPTLWLTAVTAVRHVEGYGIRAGYPAVVTGWSSAVLTPFRSGIVTRVGGWGAGVYELDITHGHTTCPPALRAAVAEMIRASRARGELASQSIGDRSESWRDGLSATAQSAIAGFTIPRSH